MSRPDHQFVQALTENLMTYALGRSLDYRDMPTVRRIVRQAAADNYRFKSIVMGVVSSDAFRKREAERHARAGADDEDSVNPDRRTLVMFLTRKHLSRRTVLKGAGATIALPLLDAMIPAGTALAQTAAAASSAPGLRLLPARRAAGSVAADARRARNPDFPFILKPLEPVRDYVTVVSGLRNKGGESSSPHGIIEETWLNCVGPRQRNAKTGVGVTVDQIAARHLGKDTPLPSLELCGEPGGMISFRTPDQPLPMESNPRKAFFGMFGQGDTQEERKAILSTTNSLLDYVTDATASLNRKLDVGRPRARERLPGFGPRDRAARAEARGERRLAGDLPGAPLGPAGGLRRAARHAVRDDRAGVADQPDASVASMKMVEEASMRTYPNLDVHEAFHPTSHWGGFPDRIANLRKIQNYHTAVFAKFVKRLKRDARGQRHGARQLDHPVRQQHGQQRRAQQRSAAAGAHRPGRRRQGQPAPALPAGHAARQHPGDDAAPRRRAGAGLREVRRQHRASSRRYEDAGQPARGSGYGLQACRAIAAVAALALLAPAWRRPQARRAPKEDVNRRKPDGSTPLQWAVYNGDVAEVKRLLRAGAKVALANNYGATPMSLAAEVGNTEMLKVLLEAGANVDSPNADGMTALLAVARTGNVEAAKLLLDRGATVDAQGEVRRADAADVGVGAPASGDDAAAHLQGRRRQRRARSIATTSVTSRPRGVRRASTAAA